MLRTFSVGLRSSRKIQTSLSSAPSKWWAPSPSPSPYSTNQGDPQPATSPKLLVVQPRLRPEKFLQAKLNEAMCLANSLEEQRDGYFHTDFFDKGLPPHLLVQNPSIKGHKPRADTYFGPGTVDNIKCYLNAIESKGDMDAVFVNTILSGIQQRNLERAWNKPVLDRVGLIIEIFNAHAFTKEAKLQAELAALSYKKTRLVRVRGPGGRYTFGASGEAEVVSARGRGSGGQGFMSGAGETELQLQRRRILDRRNYLLSQIEEVRRTRALQRAGRKRHGGSFGQGLATVAVVGYTNAGKSTLVSKLSDSDLYSDCRLFATVDPRLRSTFLPSGRKVLLSDTVGFISDLPVQLVEAFHATLEEVVEADLLVHVVDSSAPNLDEHRSTVLQVLQQIGVSEEKLQNMIEVWNKIDVEEECVEVDEYLDEDEEDDETSNFNGEDDVKSETLAETEKDYAGIMSGADNELIKEVDNHNGNYDCKQSLGDFEAIEEIEVEDYSDGWLYEDTLVNESDFCLPSAVADQQNVSSKKDNDVQKDSSMGQSGPHVKASAIMGIGLQELLELIDKKLSVQDEKSKGAQVVERSTFDRKWRPSHTQDSSIAVEQ
ncbi:GTP-binding protein At3g49725, chloroplastic [Gastrolobium bilobum]|uniref:GTP-binding protein At3g49725, chloroplastic n=1 Tax=Gastrolobium bilobum TaxID=150636 RepID=UPI002AB2691A|nr:GTP-binding protein At3g49725, chloroplastic [Gastrolobium bilobum]